MRRRIFAACGSRVIWLLLEHFLFCEEIGYFVLWNFNMRRWPLYYNPEVLNSLRLIHEVQRLPNIGRPRSTQIVYKRLVVGKSKHTWEYEDSLCLRKITFKHATSALYLHTFVYNCTSSLL
ncbi:hypothetical protein PoB_002973600 [Plakobranchus ocellatus]|uniref:Uncharacterized protein n=1 Tax=Plakobranchus ocellatus TaxID=259542 RepID=A0AAV4A4S5_9GAST|nr:hypothetical protein PoB_002973600 [Plakobranchus ocellatus]